MRAGPLMALLAALAAPAWAAGTGEAPQRSGGVGDAASDRRQLPGSNAALAGRPDAEYPAQPPGGMTDAAAGIHAPALDREEVPARTAAPAHQAVPLLRDPEAIARALFQGGDSTVQVGVAGMPPTLPARRFPCANCHGADGMGGAEGARAVPPIVPVGRPTLDAGLILLALTQGLGAEGRRLDPLMPRYDIDTAEAEALADFLAALPRQERRGVGSDRISLRLAPPPLAAPLAEAFAEGFEGAVAGRAAWGRRIELVGRDAPAFAALGFGAGDADPALPLIAPLGPAGADGGPLRALCAGFEAEIEALLATLAPGQPLAVIGAGPLADRARAIAKGAVRAGEGDAGTAVLLLARAEAGTVPPGARVLGIAAQLHGPVPDRLVMAGHRVTLSDGCGAVPGVAAGPQAGRERARQLGAAAGEAVWQALARSGRNLTRTRFLAALERGQPPLTEQGAAPVIREHLHPDEEKRHARPHLSAAPRRR